MIFTMVCNQKRRGVWGVGAGRWVGGGGIRSMCCLWAGHIPLLGDAPPAAGISLSWEEVNQKSAAKSLVSDLLV